jgi:hypothetical protein
MLELLKSKWSKLVHKQHPTDIHFHPVNKRPIKWVMKVGSMDLYEFVNTYEMPRKRFAFAQKFFQETQSKITSESLLEFTGACKKLINEGKLGECFRLLDELEYRNKWTFEPETLLRLGAVLYFTLDEDVTDYDFDYNDKKIELFKKKDMLVHFLKLLTNGQAILNSLSPEDLVTYLLQVNEVKEKQQTLISEAMGTESK